MSPDGGDVLDGGEILDAALPEDAGPPRDLVEVRVTLDGAPIAGATVVQGGTTMRALTDAEGRVSIEIDRNVGDVEIMAAHPEARIKAGIWMTEQGPVSIELVRYDPTDNPDYLFQDPGEPTRRDSSGQCGHCHVTLNDDWFGSTHRRAAQNETVQDLYAGTAAAIDTETDCVIGGGQWLTGRLPGTDTTGFRCYLGVGALASVNLDCDVPCDVNATAYAGCADCHAPGLNGTLGGRDLLEASGHAYEYGIHCDVCHRVDRVDLSAAPGVAGRLVMTRPSEPGSFALGAGGYLPLTFGPSPDSPNIRMGSVMRDHFRTSELCAGCHEQAGPPLVVGGVIDPARWPQGSLPFQSTYSEWAAGPMAPGAPCQSCHMPPAADRSNAADLQDLPNLRPGIIGGWERPPGSIRKHTFSGPSTDQRLLTAAAALYIRKTTTGTTVEARVTVENVGAGHAIPTGEPMRRMVLRVSARCADTALTAVDGDAVPDFGGYVSVGPPGLVWPRAEVGDRIRVIRRTTAFHDYEGVGPFGDGRFDAAEKGMRVEQTAGEVSVTAVASDGTVNLSAPLPAGNIAYLVRGEDTHAGAPGFAFARIMTDETGRRSVPFFRAVDVTSDNRLMPQGRFTSRHVFRTTCPDPIVEARLVYYRYPWDLAMERGWSTAGIVMTEARR